MNFLSEKIELSLLSHIDMAARIKGLVAIVLFGSTARGSADKVSDIDLLFIFSRKPTDAQRNAVASFTAELQSKLYADLNRGVDVQAVAECIGDLDKDFLETVARDGKIIFGRLKIAAGDLSLLPFDIYDYELSHLEGKDKVKFVQALLGRKKGEGFLDSIRAEKLNGNTVIVSHDSSSFFEDFLKTHKVKYKKVRIWKSGST